MTLDRTFPNLGIEGYRETSPHSRKYNCIAWAASQVHQWWWPGPGGYWPPSVVRSTSLHAFIEAFATLGYSPCGSDGPEVGYEKVALYGHEGEVKHAARQLPNGRWTSKLGRQVDIEHSLKGLEGDFYGTVVQILKRPLQS